MTNEQLYTLWQVSMKTPGAMPYLHFAREVERKALLELRKHQKRAIKNAIAALTGHCESDPACLKALKALEHNFKGYQ